MDELEEIRRKKRDFMLSLMNDKGEIKMEWPNTPIKATDADFESIVAKYPKVIVDFYADWCGPCKMVAPTLEEIAKEMKGEVVVVKVNVDEERATAMKHSVMSIPTMVIYKDGKIVDNFVGALPKGAIKQKIERI